MKHKLYWIWSKELGEIGLCIKVPREQCGVQRLCFTTDWDDDANRTCWIFINQGDVFLPIEETYCCADCGSTNVEEKAWRSVNTGEVGDIDHNDDGLVWCEDCEGLVHTIMLNKYLKYEDNSLGSESV